MNVQKLRLLFALQENPVAPATQLAKEVGVSAPTARAWLEDLRKEQVYVGVHANLRCRRLGLELDDFILQVSSYEALLRIEKFCEEHPYTSYRARVFGGDRQGIMLQFRQPDEARAHLLKSFERMKREGLVEEIQELPTLSSEYGSVYTPPRLTAWDSDSMTWRFDWNDWWKRGTQADQSARRRMQPHETVDIDKTDAHLLEQITRNARRKNTEIIEAMGLDKNEPGVQQRISAKLKRLAEEVVEDYRVFINWTHFDVYNTPFVVAKAPESSSDRLIGLLGEGGFPFGSAIRRTKDGFVWSARLPSGHVSELVTFVWSMAESYEILMIDYKHSQVYGLWAETYDDEAQQWRTDKEFCSLSPLRAIGID